MNYDIGLYDPCPCGSGEKYKFCCAAKAKDVRQGKYPIGTVAQYGPDDQTTTKIAAGVFVRDGAEPIVERWVGTQVVNDPKVTDQIKQFFATHGVKNVVVTSSNMGCPHEEGIDFPTGEDCPFCPFWAGKQGTARRDDTDDWAVDDEDDEDMSDEDLDLLDDEDDEDDLAEDRDGNAAFERIAAVVGDDEANFSRSMDKFFSYLQANLLLPCEVTGIEDFDWEEPYVLGGWSQAEYKRLKKKQPSFTDRYKLLRISRDEPSNWMMFGEDLAAHVQRVSDGKPFVLGLAELEATDKQSACHQLLDDYSVWFVNSR